MHEDGELTLMWLGPLLLRMCSVPELRDRFVFLRIDRLPRMASRSSGSFRVRGNTEIVKVSVISSYLMKRFETELK